MLEGGEAVWAFMGVCVCVHVSVSVWVWGLFL